MRVLYCARRQQPASSDYSGNSLATHYSLLTTDMGFLSFLFPWGLILVGIAIVHFIRRRPDTYWLWIIIFLGPMGALIYIAVEVIPDLGLLRQSFKVFPR